ncbi:MAG: class II fructose-bisphosphate aldolase [Solirubrobacteraceae bacterium]
MTPFSELLTQRASGTAVGAFTCYDLEEAAGALRAAAAAGAGIILLVGSQSYESPDGPLLLAALLACVAQSEARACVQLDHCGNLSSIESAVEAGVGAVMADASKLPYEGNVDFVHRAVELAHVRGCAVEAELGLIHGDEDVARAVAAGALTDPQEAAEFSSRTGVDCLAISIGNVHGIYRSEPRFDWPRLDAISEHVRVPLSLHGASGVPDEMLRQAIKAGIAKINVNTELRRAYLAATGRDLGGAVQGSNLAALHRAQTAAVEEVVAVKLDAFDVR